MSLITPGTCINTSPNCANHLEENTHRDLSASRDTCNNSKHSRSHFCKWRKSQNNTFHCWFHAVKEKSSPGVPRANKTCPVCAFIAMQNRFPMLQHHLRPLLSITMSRALRADGPLEEESGTCGEVPDGLKGPLGTLNIK